MSQNEPGLGLHEWETRWSELEEMLESDPAGALPEARDFVEQALRDSELEADAPDPEEDELPGAHRAARATADRIERGENVGPGDVGAAIENLRSVFETLRVSRDR